MDEDARPAEALQARVSGTAKTPDGSGGLTGCLLGLPHEPPALPVHLVGRGLARLHLYDRPASARYEQCVSDLTNAGATTFEGRMEHEIGQPVERRSSARYRFRERSSLNALGQECRRPDRPDEGTGSGLDLDN